MKTPAVLYAAKSTQDKHLSIPKQLEDGRQKAAEEGWEVIGEFKDEGFSAFSGNRGPDLRRATDLAEQAAAERGTTCMLIAQHSDRFARGAGDRPGAADSIIEVWLRMRRVDVHLRTFQNDSMMGKTVTVAVASEQAHEESKRKSEAVKDGIARRQGKGKTHGGKRRYGYRFEKDVGLVRIEAERVIVERMHDEYQAGKSDSAIMRGLIADGVPTALGGKWHEPTVRDILMNPLYAGLLRAGGEVLEGDHEPSVSLEKWERSQELRVARGQEGKGRGRPSSGKHLFRKGMLKCGCGCEGSMVPRTTHPGKARPNRAISETYTSYERQRDPSLCTMGPVKREAIDGAVYAYFEQVGLDVDATRRQLAESRDLKLAEVRALVEQAETDRRRAEERLERVRRDYQNELIAPDDWSEQREQLTAELTATTGKVEQLQRQVSEVEAWGELHDAERDALEKLADLRRAVAGEINDSASIDAIRAALSRLFEHFVLRRVEPGQRIPAHLAWQGEYVIEPIAREQAVEGYTDLRPVFRRELVYGGETNQASPSSCPAPLPPTASPTPTTRSPRSTPRPT